MIQVAVSATVQQKHRVLVFPSLRLSVDPILEDVQVVGGCYGDDVLRRVPSHVQDLFSEVQAVNPDVATAPLAPCVHPPGPQHCPRLAALPPGLQGHASTSLPVKHPEEAIVRPRHDHTRTEDKKIDLMPAKLVSGIDLTVGSWQRQGLKGSQ